MHFRMELSSRGTHVGIVNSRDLAEKLALLPKIGLRQFYVHSLIKSYGLMDTMRRIQVKKASIEDLLAFHSRDYVDILRNPEHLDTDDLEEVGLGYDCPVLAGLLDWVLCVAGASLSAAEALASGALRTVLHWGGGWHHAHRDSAAGFCYVNDIVLAIHKLQTAFKKILYIDLDVHHGDGVEEAFSSTNRVVTFSIHKYEAGYFPGTGSLTDTGSGRGQHHTINVPLQEGVTDKMYTEIFAALLPTIMASFSPDCVVLQCGADSLVGDPLGGFNLTPAAICDCVKRVMSYQLPTLILGGGGYNPANTARLWTQITATILGADLDDDIPDEDHFFTKYGPDFQLSITPGCVRNKNKQEDVDQLIETLNRNIYLMKSTNP